MLHRTKQFIHQNIISLNATPEPLIRYNPFSHGFLAATGRVEGLGLLPKIARLARPSWVEGTRINFQTGLQNAKGRRTVIKRLGASLVTPNSKLLFKVKRSLNW